MRAPLSIIIPTLNAAEALQSSLPPLMEGVETGLVRELVVSDGGSQDDTAEIAAGAGASVVTGPPSRGGQLRRGAEAAKGDWLLFLHADTCLSQGWSDVAGRHMAGEGADGAAGYFHLRFDASGMAPRLVAGWANLRSRLFGLPYGDQGLLIPAGLYDACGGYPDQPLMEDVAIARALSGKLRALPADAVTSAARYERDGWLRRGGRNLRTLVRYSMGVSPEDLAQDYRK